MVKPVYYEHFKLLNKFSMNCIGRKDLRNCSYKGPLAEAQLYLKYYNFWCLNFACVLYELTQQ